MSSIIADKLKEIEEEHKNGNRELPRSLSPLFMKSGSNCPELSREQTVSVLTNNDSDFYHTVKVWAGKLRSLKSEQRLYAEKAIYDVLFEAQLGNLNKSSVKINNGMLCTKESRSLYNAKYCDSSDRSLDVSERTHTASSQNDDNEYRSSEVIIAESFPVEFGGISSECQVKLDKGTLKAGDKKRKFKAAISSFIFPSYGASNSSDVVDKNDSFSDTEPPDHLLNHLSRYVNYFYNYIRSYV